MFVFGILVFNYPLISTVVNNYVLSNADQDNVTFATSVDEQLQQAEQYNQHLKENPVSIVTNASQSDLDTDDYKAYVKTLSDTDGLMGYLFIPNINVNLPMYHGVSDDSLNRGIGHLYGTALPVGGGVSVLMAHSGMSSATMFDNLSKLKNDDLVYAFYGNVKRSWKVIDTRVVLPEQVNDVIKKLDGDKLVLITCTPYGLNTHRLIVIAQRDSDVEKLEYPSLSDTHINLLECFPQWCMIPIGLDFVIFAIISYIVILRRTKRG